MTEGWARIPHKSAAKKSHYFIRDGQDTLCGHYKLPEGSKFKISFEKKPSLVCGLCKKNLPRWKELGMKWEEVIEQRSQEYKQQTSLKEERITMPQSRMFWVEGKCDEKGCNFKGSFPTSDPENAKKIKHYCPTHNLRIKETVKMEVTA